MQSNPHEEAIRNAFKMARIDYGRIDYGMLNGQMQVWEINTNPFMVYKPKGEDPRSQVNNLFYREYLKALAEIDLPSQETFQPQIKALNPSFFCRLFKYAGKLLKRG